MSTKYSFATSDVEKVTRALIKKFPNKFYHINADDMDFFEKDSLKSSWKAEVRLIKGLAAVFTKKRVALTVWKQHWETTDEVDKFAIIYHELLHLLYDEDEGKYKIRKHDIETFKEMLTDFGINDEKAQEIFGDIKI